MSDTPSTDCGAPPLDFRVARRSRLLYRVLSLSLALVRASIRRKISPTAAISSGVIGGRAAAARRQCRYDSPSTPASRSESVSCGASGVPEGCSPLVAVFAVLVPGRSLSGLSDAWSATVNLPLFGRRLCESTGVVDAGVQLLGGDQRDTRATTVPMARRGRALDNRARERSQHVAACGEDRDQHQR